MHSVAIGFGLGFVVALSNRSPRTSQRRSPPNSIAATIAWSRCVRNAAASRSTSTGDKVVGNVRGTRTSGANRDLRVPPSRQADSPRGTGFRVTPVSPRAIA